MRGRKGTSSSGPPSPPRSPHRGATLHGLHASSFGGPGSPSHSHWPGGRLRLMVLFAGLIACNVVAWLLFVSSRHPGQVPGGLGAMGDTRQLQSSFKSSEAMRMDAGHRGMGATNSTPGAWINHTWVSGSRRDLPRRACMHVCGRQGRGNTRVHPCMHACTHQSCMHTCMLSPESSSSSLLLFSARRRLFSPPRRVYQTLTECVSRPIGPCGGSPPSSTAPASGRRRRR